MPDVLIMSGRIQYFLVGEGTNDMLLFCFVVISLFCLFTFETGLIVYPWLAETHYTDS